jgi:hypothetical protein
LRLTKWSKRTVSRLADTEFGRRKTAIRDSLRPQYVVYEKVSFKQRETVQIVINIAS